MWIYGNKSSEQRRQEPSELDPSLPDHQEPFVLT